MKIYTAADFRRWYHDPARRVWPAAARRRSAAFVLALTEHLLGRPVRRVLDVGAGEGAWGVALRRLRPGLRYVGVEPSAWAVARHGRRRGLVAGRFGTLGELDLGAPFDLVLCSDVLHYVGTPELRAGLPALAARVGGIAYLETYCAEDAVEGDLRGLERRPAAWYRRRFGAAGLVQVAPQCWMRRGALAELSALERPAR